MRLTIGKKLASGIGALLALFVIIGVVSLQEQRALHQKTSKIIDLHEQIAAAVSGMKIELFEMGFFLFDYLFYNNPDYLRRMEKEKAEFSKSLSTYRQLAMTKDDKESARKLEKSYGEFRSGADELIEITDKHVEKVTAQFKHIEKIDKLLHENIQASIKTENITAHRKLEAALEMEINGTTIANGLGNFLRTHHPQYEAQLSKAEQNFRRSFDSYSALFLSSQEKQRLEEIVRLFHQAVSFSRDIIELDKRKLERMKHIIEIQGKLDGMLDDEIHPRVYRDLEKAKEDALQTSKRGRLTIIVILALAMVVGILSGILTAKSIISPVKQLVSFTKVVSKGDLSGRVEIKSDDEVKVLGESFNRMLEELHQTMVSRQYVENIIDSMTETLIVISADGTIQTVNPAACKLLGYGKKELMGQPFTKIFVEEEIEREDALLRNGILFIGSNVERVYRSKDGNKIPVLFSSAMMLGEDDKIKRVVCIALDITERKQAEQYLKDSNEQLRALSTQLQTIREEERTAISREVHDELGQALTALKIDLSWLNRRLLVEQEQMRQKIWTMFQLIDETIQSVRRLCSELRPGILDDLGLIAAIEWETGEFRRRTGIECRFITSMYAFNLDRERNTMIFRILQETLTNVFHHAKASRVRVDMKNQDGRLIMEIEDNGKGITQTDIANPKSLGILGMRERVRLFRGELDINGIPGKGTTVTLRIPIKSEQIKAFEISSPSALREVT